MKSGSQTLALLLFVGLNAPVGAKRVEHKRGVHAGVAKRDALDKPDNIPTSIPKDWYDKEWASVQSNACKDDKTKALIEASSGLAKMRYQAVDTNQNDCSWILTRVANTPASFSKSVQKNRRGQLVGGSTWNEKIGDVDIAATFRTAQGTTLAGKKFNDWAKATIRVSAKDSPSAVFNTMKGITAHDSDHHMLVVGNSEDTHCWQVDYSPKACHFQGQFVGATKDDGKELHYAAIIAGKK